MAAKNWTTKEIEYIRKNALLAETNAVLNVDQLAKKLSRPSKSVEMKIYKMRKDGQLPKTDYTKSFDAKGRKFSAEEDKRIIAMYKQEETYRDIGESLGRSEQSIHGRIVRLKESGKIKPSVTQKNWSEKEIQLIIENIQFDENGFVLNYPELARLTNKKYSQVTNRVCRLRKKGLITVQADRSKTSIKSKKAMDRFNCARFGKRMEEQPVKDNSVQTNVNITTQSKMIQMIMTIVEIGNERTTNFFTTEGELLAVKKEAI
ncbi:hypothetical protein UAY_01812 [Enterococcus moraviensis ATCC BAA-383]|uniref:Uncharacterized protein n=1 Tax=Enterococcus moraviensis ATCC BAA-383 TaxID=1158609 RepID=R2T6N5_9ENTE|nr:helix-turn-helix domain-containing protein [Enterococcus moraviensis]EOI00709.1 hypothetical protein UAY_01812 [Enterococcus moraviensis ATCC BAA-383]EOT73062.1 hypothetical protein I586_00055 [Enterococcus moraviensis ATCC BAA-383]OJG68623.1 hypothetical protein RV09_GL000022 [Enterococcus moraviensis]